LEVGIGIEAAFLIQDYSIKYGPPTPLVPTFSSIVIIRLRLVFDFEIIDNGSAFKTEDGEN